MIILIEYENNGDKNRNLPLDEHLNKIKTFLRNILIDSKFRYMPNSVSNCN